MTTLSATLAPTPQPWRTHAACRGHDPALFFPAEATGRGVGNQARRDAWDAGRRICATCPATGPAGPCVAEGFELGDVAGLRGGLTPDEREPLRRAWMRREGTA